MGIFREIKWHLRYPYVWFRNKMTRQLQEQIRAVKREMDEQEQQNHLRRQEIEYEMRAIAEASEKRAELLQTRIEKMEVEAEAFEKQAEACCIKRTARIQEQIGAAARQVMHTKWQVMDLITHESGSDILTCRICGHSQQREAYDTKETDCIFHGGHLIRYVCPKCGVIFGPTKFTNMKQEEIDHDYQVHYLGFSEGDSSKKERKAFFMLHPSKEGVYLNYGCGHWSNSLQFLREQGYQVFGYEPYSPEADNPYMITNKDVLSKMRFDGIYSNDVLEHLLDPIEELVFMRGLLLNMDSKMAHSTACYIYKYEYTRFHTHFFTGDSVSVMCEKSGVRIVDACNEIEENDFICYVFASAERPQTILKDMYIKNSGEKDAGGNIILHQKGILYGPYYTLAGREYCLDIQIQGDALLRITAACGQEELRRSDLRSGMNQIRFALSGLQENVEFVVENRRDLVVIEDIRLS